MFVFFFFFFFLFVFFYWLTNLNMLSKSKLDVTYARRANKIDFINRPERLYVLYYIIIILNVTGLIYYIIYI